MTRVALIILLIAQSHSLLMTILWGSKARLPYHTFFYGPRWKMETSAWPCTRANFRNDGTKTRHACKLNPEDSEAVSSTGNSTRHTRWQPPKKTPSFATCLNQRDMVCSSTLRSSVNISVPNFTSLVHFKTVVASMSHSKLPLLDSGIVLLQFSTDLSQAI